MTTDNSKTIKELLEVIKSKVSKTETKVNLLFYQVKDVKDQQSVMNEKLDNLDKRTKSIQSDVKILDKKADKIFEFAEHADENLQETKRRVTRLEKPQAVAS